MRNAILHLAAAMAMAFAGTALASDPDGIQEAEEPGSEIEIEFDDGKATIERKDGEPLFGGGGGGEGTALEPLDDPDDPVAPDPLVEGGHERPDHRVVDACAKHDVRRDPLAARQMVFGSCAAAKPQNICRIRSSPTATAASSSPSAPSIATRYRASCSKEGYPLQRE